MSNNPQYITPDPSGIGEAAVEGTKVTLKDIVRQWNLTVKKYGLPLTQRYDDQRGASFRKMAKNIVKLQKKSAWRDYFKLIGKAPDLNGTGETGFKATLDWALSPRNYRRVLAGEFPIPQRPERAEAA